MELVKQQQTAIAETATAAAAAQAQAMVQARYVMALQRPRDWDQVRETVLKECARPAMAAVALWKKPVGQKTLEGPSVRLAEAAMRAMTNVSVETPAVYDDDQKRILKVIVTDLESNCSFTKDVTVAKEVERRHLKDGQRPRGSRVNSYGDKVYLIDATDDDVLNKENNLVSKTFRTLFWKVFPGALLDEAIATVKKTLLDAAAKDPDGEKRKILDAFVGIGVGVAALKDFLGHAVDTLSPAELVELRGVYQAIKDGESTWQEMIDQRRAQRAPAPAAPSSGTAPPPAEGKGAAGFKVKVGAKKQAPAPAPPKDDGTEVFSAPTAPADQAPAGMTPEEMAEIAAAEREPGEEG